MKKTYKSKLRDFNVYIPINGKLTNVEFRKGYICYSIVGCLFTTEDGEIQKALEAHPKFNHKFWTDDKEEVVETPAETPAETTEENPVEKKVKRYTPKK